MQEEGEEEVGGPWQRRVEEMLVVGEEEKNLDDVDDEGTEICLENMNIQKI